MPSTHSIEFDGSSTYAEAADSASLSITGDISIEAWIYVDTLDATSQSIYYKWVATGNQRAYDFVIEGGTDKLQFEYTSSGSDSNSNIFKTDAAAVTTGKWYHVAVTSDVSAKTATFYVNGKSVASTKTNDGGHTAIADTTAVVGIGAASGGGGIYFDGKIDDLRVWSDIRTAEEIRQNMDADTPNGDNLAAHWKFDNTNNDETGNNNLTANTGSFSTDAAFMTKGIDLNGSSQYLSITDALQTGLDLSTDFTFEVWVKPDSLPTSGNLQKIFAKWRSGQASYGLDYYNNSGTLQLRVFVSGTSGGGYSTYTHTLSTVAWTHIAVSCDISVPSCRWYINGSPFAETSNTMPSTDITNSTSPFEIGVEDGANFFPGLIDDCRVWNDIRTDAEIAEFYDIELSGKESNLIAYWKLNNNYVDHTGNGNTLTPTATPTFTTDVGITATQTIVTFPAAGANAPADGYTQRSVAGETWDTIHDGNGTEADVSTSPASFPWIRSTTTTDQYNLIRRSHFMFDTSNIDSGTVVASTLSIVAENNQSDGFSNPVNIYGSAPASTSTIVASDHQLIPDINGGSTQFSTGKNVTSDWVADSSTYNDFILNASGIAAIAKTGTSKFSLLFEADGDDEVAQITWASSTSSYVSIYYADSGASTAPKLIAYYTTAASGPATLKTVSGTAAASVKTKNGVNIANVKTWNSAS